MKEEEVMETSRSTVALLVLPGEDEPVIRRKNVCTYLTGAGEQRARHQCTCSDAAVNKRGWKNCAFH